MLHQPDNPNGDAIVLTHGAGSNCNAPLLVRLANAFAEAGYLTLRYDLPFRVERSAGPPSPAGAARDRQGILEAVDSVRPLATGRIIAGGHSYGGRQTAMTAAEKPGVVDAILLLSYPLHPPGKPDQKRTAFFPELRTPALFVHGDNDPFGSVDDLREAVTLIPAPTDLFIIGGAAHDLKKAGALGSEILTRIQALLR
jgi:predicted alpha/beta-hydrolase family hydrolase